MASKHYIALIHKEEDSGYGVSFPDVPGVTTVGDTMDDALRLASEVLAFAFEDWDGALPRSRSLDDLRRDPAFLEEAADAVVAVIQPLQDLPAVA